MKKRSKSRPKLSKKPFIVVGLVVIVLLIAFVIVDKTTSLFKKSPDMSGSSYTKGIPQSSGSSSSSSSTSSKGDGTSGGSSSSSGSSSTGSTSQSSGSTTQATLTTPLGNFVSDHHPNHGGSPAPNTITSVCSTTPGATCIISFTMNGVTKSLPKQTVDAGGSTYWNNWTLQSVGLTAGSWKIQATATLNGQTATATDAMDLVVSP